MCRLQDRQVTVAAASQHHQQQQHADQLTQAPSLTSSAEPSPQSEQCSSAAQQYGPSSQQYSLAAQQYSPAAQQYSPVSDLAKVGQDRGPHWLLHVLFIVGLNILGLWGVLKLIGWAKDCEYCTSGLDKPNAYCCASELCYQGKSCLACTCAGRLYAGLYIRLKLPASLGTTQLQCRHNTPHD